ncbi:penicillin-insensitive murein endopeptidase [Elusimicrobiota bacterium]
MRPIRLLAAWALISALMIPTAGDATAAPALASEGSVCHGTRSKGRLDGGVRLPKRGENFAAYSTLGVLLGRTYVHDRVAGVIRDSFAALSKSHPDKRFMYGETGRKKGGRFRPHRTHQNGLSVDFMVPVTKGGNPAYLPTSVFNKFGYGIEFDDKGTFEDYRIDFGAIAAHLAALHEASKKGGIGISIVILDPKLQPLLFKTKEGAGLRKKMRFSRKRVWVRHDDHYHVDFVVPCGK